MDNDIQFQREGRSYVAEIQIIDTAARKRDFGDEGHGAPKRELDQAYPIIYALIKPQEGKKGSKMNLNVLRFHIEEIYSMRFIKDTKTLANPDDTEVESFQEFFANFMMQKYKKKDTLEQVTINILSSIEFYSRQYKDIRVFARFLREDYDTDDLIFFLFVRNCIEKELKIIFVEKMRHAINGQLDDNANIEIFVPYKSSGHIGQLVFGRTDERALENFNNKVAELFEKEAVGSKRDLMVRAYSILAFAVDDYHNKEEKDQNSVSEFNANDKSKKAPAKRPAEKSERNSINERQTERVNTTEQIEDEEDQPQPSKIVEEKEEEEKVSTKTNTKKNTKGKTGTKTGTSPRKAASPTKKAPRSDYFMNVLKKSGAMKSKIDVEKLNSLKNVINCIITEKELAAYVQRLIDNNQTFQKNASKINKSIGKIKTYAQQKMNLLTSFLFLQDKKKFLATIAMKENNVTGGKYYSTLGAMKEHMLKTTPFSNLDENAVNKFIKALTDIPELVQMINKNISDVVKK